MLIDWKIVITYFTMAALWVASYYMRGYPLNISKYAAKLSLPLFHCVGMVLVEVVTIILFIYGTTGVLI